MRGHCSLRPHHNGFHELGRSMMHRSRLILGGCYGVWSSCVRRPDKTVPEIHLELSFQSRGCKELQGGRKSPDSYHPNSALCFRRFFSPVREVSFQHCCCMEQHSGFTLRPFHDAGRDEVGRSPIFITSLPSPHSSPSKLRPHSHVGAVNKW